MKRLIYFLNLKTTQQKEKKWLRVQNKLHRWNPICHLFFGQHTAGEYKIRHNNRTELRRSVRPTKRRPLKSFFRLTKHTIFFIKSQLFNRKIFKRTELLARYCTMYILVYKQEENIISLLLQIFVRFVSNVLFMFCTTTVANRD